MQKDNTHIAGCTDTFSPLDTFTPPFRVGRKQQRAVLDSKGLEVVVFRKGLERYALAFANFLNSLAKTTTKKA